MPITPADLKLVNKKKEAADGATLFSDDTKVMLYFSAHWCPPCRAFTPLLAEFYSDAKEQEQPVECVFISCDRDEKSMWSYFEEEHGDYYALPYDAPERMELAKQHNVSGIPALVVVDKAGRVIRSNARSEVQTKGPNCIKEWK